MIDRKWVLRLLSLCIAPLACAAGQSDAPAIHYDFTARRFDVERLQVIGDQRFLNLYNDGLRIVLPKDAPDEKAGAASNQQLVGDWEISARYKLLDVPQPKDGYGAGAALLVEDGERYGASLQRVRTPNGDNVFIAHYYARNDQNEYDHRSESFPTDCTRGTLKLVREGDLVRYLVAENDAATVRELFSTRLTSAPIKRVEIFAQSGGAANAAAITWIDLELRAESVLEPGQSTTQQKTSLLKWIVILVLLAAVGTGGAWWIARRRES